MLTYEILNIDMPNALNLNVDVLRVVVPGGQYYKTFYRYWQYNTGA
jgi:hypothetical protein